PSVDKSVVSERPVEILERHRDRRLRHRRGIGELPARVEGECRAIKALQYLGGMDGVDRLAKRLRDSPGLMRRMHDRIDTDTAATRRLGEKLSPLPLAFGDAPAIAHHLRHA